MEQVTEALRILADDPKVQVILVNIFGGIMRCDTVAAGLVKAVEILALKKPLVVRLQGTNLEQGKQLLHASTLKIIPADDLEEAASRSCKVRRSKKKEGEMCGEKMFLKCFKYETDC